MISPELSVLLSSWSVQAISCDRPELAKAVEEIKDLAEAVRLADKWTQPWDIGDLSRYRTHRDNMRKRWGT